MEVWDWEQEEEPSSPEPEPEPMPTLESVPPSPTILAFHPASPSQEPVDEDAELEWRPTSQVDSLYAPSTTITYDPVWIKRKGRPSRPEFSDDLGKGGWGYSDDDD
jgi:hypothetical protein